MKKTTKPDDQKVTNAKTIRVYPLTWKILQTNCPKGLPYSQFLHSIITEKFGTKVVLPPTKIIVPRVVN
ncbi:MAG: hypothetical protein WCF03_21585 [Nitrososphaeraceae archaeon]